MINFGPFFSKTNRFEVIENRMTKGSRRIFGPQLKYFEKIMEIPLSYNLLDAINDSVPISKKFDVRTNSIYSY